MQNTDRTQRIDVSVCIATRNSAATLEAALKSVLAQQNVVCEILIADCLSLDSTLEICERYRDRIAWIKSEQDRGVYDSWNKMLDRVRGEWVSFLGSDDRFADVGALAALVAKGRSDPSRLVYGRVIYEDDAGAFCFEQGRPWSEVRAQLKTHMTMPHVGMLQARMIFDEGYRFDPAMRISGDFDLIRREGLSNGATFLDRIIVRAGVGGLSTNRRAQLVALKESGTILKRQDGRRPFYWYKRYSRALLQSALYRFAGERGLAVYDKTKALLRRWKLLSTAP